MGKSQAHLEKSKSHIHPAQLLNALGVWEQRDGGAAATGIRWEMPVSGWVSLSHLGIKSQVAASLLNRASVGCRQPEMCR